MKRILAFALLFVLAAVAASAETISVYNWGDYIDVDTLAQFTEETGIEVIYEVYETNEDMYAKIANGGASICCSPSTGSISLTP